MQHSLLQDSGITPSTREGGSSPKGSRFEKSLCFKILQNCAVQSPLRGSPAPAWAWLTPRGSTCPTVGGVPTYYKTGCSLCLICCLLWQQPGMWSLTFCSPGSPWSDGGSPTLCLPGPWHCAGATCPWSSLLSQNLCRSDTWFSHFTGKKTEAEQISNSAHVNTRAPVQTLVYQVQIPFYLRYSTPPLYQNIKESPFCMEILEKINSVDWWIL